MKGRYIIESAVDSDDFTNVIITDEDSGDYVHARMNNNLCEELNQYVFQLYNIANKSGIGLFKDHDKMIDMICEIEKYIKRKYPYVSTICKCFRRNHVPNLAVKLSAIGYIVDENVIGDIWGMYKVINEDNNEERNNTAKRD